MQYILIWCKIYLFVLFLPPTKSLLNVKLNLGLTIVKLFHFAKVFHLCKSKSKWEIWIKFCTVKNLSYYSPGKFYSNLAFCSKEIDNFYTNILTGYKTISKQIILHDGKQITPLSVPLSVPLGGSVCTMGCPLIVYLQSYQCVKILQYISFLRS